MFLLYGPGLYRFYTIACVPDMTPHLWVVAVWLLRCLIGSYPDLGVFRRNDPLLHCRAYFYKYLCHEKALRSNDIGVTIRFPSDDNQYLGLPELSVCLVSLRTFSGGRSRVVWLLIASLRAMIEFWSVPRRCGWRRPHVQP